MMNSYMTNPAALAGLIRDDQVHRDVYTDPDVFRLEMRHLWSRAWLYVGHASQVPNTGDYLSTTLAGQPVIMIRHSDSSIRVVMNRCAHKGANLVLDSCGNTGKFLRCPYHAWTYRTDGSLLSIPLKNDYAASGVMNCEAGKGLAKPGAVQTYRGLVFARLAAEGDSFEDYFGEMLNAIDTMSDRSPLGELEVVGPALRSTIHCNWKMYLENVNDTVHPISTHESAASAAKTVGESISEKERNAVSMEQLLPFGANYSFYAKMGARVLENGHSVLGTQASLHSAYAPIPGYEQMLSEAHGETRTREVLAFSPQNMVLYPSLAIKANPSLLRVLRPIGADKTLLEVWALAPKGAPEVLRQQSMSYVRLVFSPMSVVAHDDIRLFESAQCGLQASGNEWVSLHRGHRGEAESAEATDFEDGNNEILMRNQFRAWARLMTPQQETTA